MGLDGISINQLRMVPENNSAESNRIMRLNLPLEHKVVDGLNEGQKVDPDKEQDKDEEATLSRRFDSEEELQNDQEEIVKYDLSDSGKYFLKLEEETNNILIIERVSLQIVQKIDADKLSNYVGFLSNSQGSIVNRKF